VTVRRSRPRVKLQAIPKFPADIVAGTGITIERSGATFTFSIDTDVIPDLLDLDIGSDVQAWNGRLQDLADETGIGIVAVTAAGSIAVRTLTAPAAGLTITDGNGVLGNPTFAFANDLAALEALSSTGFAARTASDTWAQRTLTVSEGLTVTNPAGIAGDPLIALAAILTPCGRITLTSGAPVLEVNTTGRATVYYTPHNGHRFVPVNNGTAVVPVDIGGELSQTTTDNTKSPAAVANNSIYDYFIWVDGATVRFTRGPAWSSGTFRGIGAGTTELERNTTTGTRHNKFAITNGPAAGRGTYVGSVRSNGSAQIDFIFGGDSAGGTAAVISIWNAYNRVDVAPKVGDTTPNWTYTSNTLRPSNNSTNMRISYLSGLPEDGATFTFQQEFCLTNVIAAYGSIGLGFNSTTVSGAYSSFSMGGNTTTGQCVTLSPTETFAAQTGWNFVQALERSDGTNAVTFTGGVAIPDFGYSRLMGQLRW
jgi:hypothetical protein